MFEVANVEESHVVFEDAQVDVPIKQRPYRTSPKCKQEIDRQVDDMLQKGIIRESVSPWSSPVVLVKRKGCSFRFLCRFKER